MSSTKLNPTRALKVIPSDDCNVPSPNLLIEGETTDYSDAVTLIDTNVQFIVSGESESTASQGTKQFVVNVGDVVYSYQTGLAATIVEVLSDTELLLNAEILDGGSGVRYYIYQEGPTTGQGNQGCLLYIGAAGSSSLHITTIGQDDMEIPKATLGLFVIQTKKVWFTDTGFVVGDIYAIW